ncbi:MAG TPA: nucleotide pyrophosphohydrolase [Candidatus Saccharimonadales bacterium]|nr:nucleotide pyrophosphohydrolase [Candidatus Saccharimonadales bacterium]
MPKKSDQDTTIQELKDMVKKFGAERHWQRHHTPKNLAMGIAIEAAELMEHYQWERAGKPDPDEVADELSDVLFNLLNFAMIEKIDITSAFMAKHKKLQAKYPKEKFNKGHDDLDEYRKIKKAYRQGKK